MSRTLTRIWLVFIAVYPILIAISQIVSFLLWLFDLDMQKYVGAVAGSYSPIFLAISLIVSIRERFCAYHRLCIVSVFMININHLWAFRLTPEISNYISIAILLAGLVGIIGAIIHFGFQINDFIRYERLQSKKQDSYQGALRIK